MPYTAGPFDAPHLYLQWGGKLPGNEDWSCGLRMAGTGTMTSLDPGPMLAAVSAAVEAYHARAGTAIGVDAILTHVKLNQIGTDGHYTEDTTFEHVSANIGGGGTTYPTPPNQIALAVSMVTGYSRGPAHRGRFYLPLPSVGTLTSGLFSSGVRDAMITSANTFLTALNAVNPTYDVAVFSRKAGAPAHRLVTGFKIGRVLDTQRRRRRSLAETY